MATKATPAAARPTPQQTPQNAPGQPQAGVPMAPPAPGMGALALPADLMAELAGAAKDAAAKERPAVGRVSLKSGLMTYQDAPVPNNTMEVVIVGGAYRNVYYSGSYDPDNIVNPDCFALADDASNMEAHENVPDDAVPDADPKADRKTTRSCEGCAAGAWGSAMRNGRPSKGKACKQTRRLIMLPANQLESGDATLAAEMAILDVPVTSVRNYANLVNTLAATINLPVWAVVTRVSVAPHPRNQFEVSFTPVRPAGDETVIRALMKRRDEAMRIALVPYDGTGGENDPEAGKQHAAPLKRKF